jgi:hypothetical protein
MPDTIERLIAKIGRNLLQATESRFRNEAHLQSKVKFRDAIRSGPLGGKHNQRQVQEHVMVRDLQQRTAHFRDTIIIPFDDGRRRLCAFIDNPDVLNSVAPTFTFRFHVLNYLCRIVGLEGKESFSYFPVWIWTSIPQFSKKVIKSR